MFAFGLSTHWLQWLGWGFDASEQKKHECSLTSIMPTTPTLLFEDMSGLKVGSVKSQIFLSFQTHLDGSDSILKLGNLSWDSDFENPHFWGSVFVCSWFLGLGLDSKFLRQRTSHRQGHMTFSEWETLNESIKPPNDSIHYPYPPLINLRICPLPPHTTVIHYGDLITTLSFIFGLTLKYNVTHQKTVTFSKAPTK